MMDIITKLDEKNELQSMAIAQVKDRLTQDAANSSIFSFTKGLIKDLHKAKRIGTARSYGHAIAALRGFRNDAEIEFNEITVDFLNRFELWHISKDGNGYGGLGVYMRSIRAIYNKAIKAGYADRDAYPFAQYTIKKGKPRKRAIAPNGIQDIKKSSLIEGSALERDRNIFMLSFYLRGMPYVDLIHLKIGHFIDGKIQYAREKTDEPMTVNIPEKAWPYVKYFLKGRTDPNEYLLPIIKREDPIEQYNDMLSARALYNKNLRKLAKKAGIQERLTSYVPRHSFATLADDMDVPITAISKMLGHQKISTTQAYIDDLRKNRLDEFQDKVIEGI